MKKLYLLLVALIVAAIPALAADWYLVGEGLAKEGQGSSWADSETFGLQKVNGTENIYKIDGINFSNSLESNRFKIKKAGTWDDAFGTNNSSIELNVVYSANKGANDIYFSFAAENTTLSINTKTYELLISNDGSVLQEAALWTYWDEMNQRGYDFAEVDGKQQVTVKNISGQFKIRKGVGSSEWWYGPDNADKALTFDEDYCLDTNKATSAASVSEEVVNFAGEITITLVDAAVSDHQIKIRAEGKVVPVAEWYIVGQNYGNWFQDNIIDASCKLEATETDGVYTKTFDGFDGGDFKFVSPKSSDDIWGGTQIGPNDGQEIQYNQSVTGNFGGGSNFSLAKTSDRVVLTLNVKTGVFEFKKAEAPQETLKYYFVWEGGEQEFVSDGGRPAVRLEQMPAKFHVEGRNSNGQLVTRWGQDVNTTYRLGSYFSDYYLKPGYTGEGALADNLDWHRVMVLITSTKANNDGELTISVLRDFLPSITSNSRWFLEIEGVNTLTEFRFGMAGHYLDYAEVPTAFRVVELKADGTQVTYGTTTDTQAGGYETYLTAGARDKVGYLRTSTALTNLSLVLSIVSDTQVALQSEALETLPITEELYIIGNTIDYVSKHNENPDAFPFDNSGNVRWHANLGVALTKIADGVFYGEGIEFFRSYSDQTHSVFSFVTKLAKSADGWTEIAGNRLGARIQRYDLAKIDGLRLSFKAYANQNAILIEPGVYNVGVNLNTRTVTIMKPNELLDENDDLYIVGDLNYYWHFTRSVKMERSEDGGKVTYTADGFNLVPANAYWWNKDATEQHVDYGRIMIVSKPVEDVLIDRGSSNEEVEAGRVAAPRRADENPVPPVEDHGLSGINLGTRYQISSTTDADGNYSLTPVIGGINDDIEPTELPVGNYKFTITSDANGNKTLSKGDATIQTGVENVADDNADAPVEYYTLQGIRVMEPSAGIYLRRQGTAVTKILVK